MTQSNKQGSEELRAIIAWHSEYMLYTIAGNDGGTVNRLREHAETTTLNSLKKYLAIDRKQHELEARIDEVNKSFKAFGSYDKQLKTNIPRDDTQYLARRIAELRDELKLLGEE